MEDAKVFWISTVHPDGRPHVTPLIAVLSDGALYFCTGPRERKAENLALNPHCVLTTGCNSLDEGVDLVVEGHAALIAIARWIGGTSAGDVPRRLRDREAA